MFICFKYEAETEGFMRGGAEWKRSDTNFMFIHSPPPGRSAESDLLSQDVAFGFHSHKRDQFFKHA